MLTITVNAPMHIIISNGPSRKKCPKTVEITILPAVASVFRIASAYFKVAVCAYTYVFYSHICRFIHIFMKYLLPATRIPPPAPSTATVKVTKDLLYTTIIWIRLLTGIIDIYLYIHTYQLDHGTRVLFPSTSMNIEYITIE